MVKMDKKIKKIIKENKKVGKQLDLLLKEDQIHDKEINKSKKIMKKNK